MSRAEEADAELEALYAQVPEIGCKGLCADACGPIDGGLRERVRMARAGVKLPPKRSAARHMARTGHYTCPALDNGQCSTYAARPMVCRIWGASEDLPCPYGCQPADGKLLSSAKTLALLDAANAAGERRQPLTVEQYEQELARPGRRAWLSSFIPKPVDTRTPRPE